MTMNAIFYASEMYLRAATIIKKPSVALLANISSNNHKMASTFVLLALSCATAMAVMDHNSYYPGGHSSSYYTPLQMHTYGSKYYNTDSYGKYDDGKDSHSHYEPNYYTQYNPVASYYHSYAPKYNSYGKDTYSHYTPSYTPYYGSYYNNEQKHDDYHAPHHFDIHH